MMMQSNGKGLGPNAVIWAIAVALAGCAAEDEPDTGNARNDDEFEDLLFDVTVARAYPADAAVHESPLAATLNPCQSTLHIAFSDGDYDDLDVEYRDTEAPVLRLSHESGDEVTFDGGTFLSQSVVFDLDTDVVQDMAAGPWSAQVLIDDDVVARVPAITRVATGDANLDGNVGSDDLVAIFQGGLYEADGEASWSTGDFTCDGRASTADLVAMYQAREGVVYESGPYVGPADEDAWRDEEGRWVVTDYQCWLVGYGAEEPLLRTPSQSNTVRDRLDYSGMSIDRQCSEPSWEPFDVAEAEEGGSSMVFYDARVSSFVTSACAWGGSTTEWANEDLATVAESWSGGHATITSEGNAARDVRLVCEPFYNTIDDVYGERFGDKETCTLDIRGEGKGKAFAYAKSVEEDYEVVGEEDATALASAKAESELLLEFPNLSAVGDLELGGSDAAPPGLRAKGTAVADANGRDEARILSGENAKCRVGVEGGIGKKPSIYGQCFVEVNGSEAYQLVSDAIESFSFEGEEVTTVTHVGWVEDPQNSSESAKQLVHQKEISIVPAELGPVSGKKLGRLRVMSTQTATSNSTTADDLIIASEATGRAEGSLSITVAFPNPEFPDEFYDWVPDVQDAWEQANSPSRCKVGLGHRNFDGLAPTGPEPKDENFVLRDRGRKITVGVGDFDRRYWIGRDGQTVQSYAERFGVW